MLKTYARTSHRFERFNEAFDTEGTKKKIRNFIRKVVREHPEMLERWNAVMEADIDSHDDYGELQMIHTMFKDYGSADKEIKFEKDTNSFEFIIPLSIHDCYPDYQDINDLEKELQEAAKEYFGVQEVECRTVSFFSSLSTLSIKIWYGNASRTPAKILKSVGQRALKRLGTVVAETDTYKVLYNGKQLPYKMYVLRIEPKFKSGSPILTLAGFVVISEESSSGKDYSLFYVQDGGEYRVRYEKNDTADSLYKDLMDQLSGE